MSVVTGGDVGGMRAVGPVAFMSRVRVVRVSATVGGRSGSVDGFVVVHREGENLRES